MWNRTGRSGVYGSMRCACLLLVCSLTIMGQPTTLEDRLTAAIQAMWEAPDKGPIEAIAARRDEARALLQRAPVDSPRFAGWVQQLANIYQNAGLNAQARALLLDALLRVAPLGDSSSAKMALLDTLGESWRNDGNLLKAVTYLEQEAAAAAVAKPAPAPAQSSRAVFSVMISGPNMVYSGSRFQYGNNAVSVYNRLATLYQQLGRPEAAAAVASKILALSANDQPALAGFYEQHGQLDEAGAIYRKIAESSTDPQEVSNAWQSLANLDARQQRYNDAIDTMQKAVATVQQSGNPGVRDQSLWMRISLAGYMASAGLLDQTDEAYAELRQEFRNGPEQGRVIAAQAQYLAGTNRGAQGETLLKQYLAADPNMEPQDKRSTYFQLANVARSMGNSKASEEYQKAAPALEPTPQPTPVAAAPRILINDDLQNAQKAADAGRLDEAYRLALHAADTAGQATDGQQAEWRIPQIAQSLAAKKEMAKADQLFQHLLATAQASPAVPRNILVGATRSYARFLTGQPDRANEAPAAIESLRRVLADANGPDSATLLEALRMKLDLVRTQARWSAVDGLGRELLQAQESMSGNTSEAYLMDLQSVASMYTATSDFARALPLRRKAVAISDLLCTPNGNSDWRRSQTRMDAAMALAHLHQFEEAETLAQEAIALQAPARTPAPNLSQQLDMIRQMKKAAQK